MGFPSQRGDRSGGVLDGAVLAAGIGPSPGPDRPRKIAQINQLGTVELLTALRPALAASGDARAVVFGSNSASVTPGVPRRVIRALRAGEIDRAVRTLRLFGPVAPNIAYAASKIAVTDSALRSRTCPQPPGSDVRFSWFSGPEGTRTDEQIDCLWCSYG